MDWERQIIQGKKNHSHECPLIRPCTTEWCEKALRLWNVNPTKECFRAWKIYFDDQLSLWSEPYQILRIPLRYQVQLLIISAFLIFYLGASYK